MPNNKQKQPNKKNNKDQNYGHPLPPPPIGFDKNTGHPMPPPPMSFGKNTDHPMPPSPMSFDKDGRPIPPMPPPMSFIDDKNTNQRKYRKRYEHKPQGGFGRGGSPGQQMAMPIERPKNAIPTINRIWQYMNKYKIRLVFILILLLISSILSVYGTKLIGNTIDKYIDLPVINFSGLLNGCLYMLGIYALSAIFMWLQSLMMLNISQKAVSSMRKELFEKLQALPLKFFDSRTHGELMSRVTNDIDNISQALSTALTQVISSIVTLVATIVMMLIISPILALATLLTVPLLFIITKKIAKRSRKYFATQQNILGELNGLIEETISGQKTIKVFNREEKEIRNFQDINLELRSSGIKAQIFSGIIMPIINGINNISYALVAGIGAILIILKMVTIGDISSFIIYARQFARPLNELANMINVLQSAIAGAERVFEIMDEEQEPADAPNAYKLTEVKGEVIFKSVDFSYNKTTPILKNINLYANPGQTIALVGPTGAGKTTIINLLTRFYDIDKGTITIDGHDISTINRNSLRSSLGIVLQDTYLFTGTIKDNIRYGRLNATDEEIKKASKLANAHEFIRRLPQGYETILTEDGSNLSQGQRQMLAIARAILADPAILILDEATSSVDTRTEIKIQEAMLNLMKGRTSFVIAHRLSTIRNADLITVINGGEIIERGNHQQLLTKGGFYNNLYMSQFTK